MDIVLASKSPRRAQLLRQIGVCYQTVHIDVPEEYQLDEAPERYVCRLALAKANAGLAIKPNSVVLGADTIVCVDDNVLEKPEGLEDFRRMLTLLSGRQHEVKTAVAVVDQERQVVECSSSQVFFRDIGPEEIDQYWQTGEPLDKAGGYGIQGFGAVFVTEIVGSYSGIVGLPLETLFKILLQFNVTVWGNGRD